MIASQRHPSGRTTLETKLGPGVVFPISEWADFDWPPRLTLEQQQVIVYQAAQNFIRFTAPMASLNVVPRQIRQRLYREAVR